MTVGHEYAGEVVAVGADVTPIDLARRSPARSMWSATAAVRAGPGRQVSPEPRHVAITDVSRYRLELAGRVADVRPVNIAEESLDAVRAQLKMREGFDIALEMSGVPQAFHQMIESMIMGGRIALLGIPAGPSETDWRPIIANALTIKAIYGREMFETWYKMLAMLQSGLDISKIVTTASKRPSM